MLAPFELRVFVSSTFEDLAAERDALHALFRELDALCRQHGGRLHAVDLRWGISEAAARDRRTMEICREEVRRCRAFGTRSVLLVLLGERYGWVPLPAELEAEEMERLLPAMTEEQRSLVARSYRRDENALPPTYRSSDPSDPQLEERLRSALSAAAHAIYPDARGAVFDRSATHLEIEEALRPGLPEVAPLVFVRERGGVARERLLEELERSLSERLPASCFCRGSSTAELCRFVEQSLRAIIEALGRDRRTEQEHEPEAHLAFARSRAGAFAGRASLCARISLYVAGDEPEVLVISGPSGSGKTTLLAKAACDAASSGETRVLARFVGATPRSGHVASLIEDLCAELASLHGGATSRPLALDDLVVELAEQLQRAAAGRRVLVVLDALDNLGGRQSSFIASLLSAALPAGARVIASVSSHSWLAETRAAQIELGALTAADRSSLVAARLASLGRTLRAAQEKVLLESLAASPDPLFATLAIEEASRWTSYDAVESMPSQLAGAARALLERLSVDAAHGRLLVERTLALVLGANRGLSEEELLDLLSADTELLADLHRRSPRSPGADRLPAILWARLREDLRPQLEERAEGNERLIQLHHPRIARTIAEEYLARDSLEAARHRIANYFLRAPDARKWSELPAALRATQRWDELVDALSDLRLLEDRAVATNIFEVVAELQLALEFLPRDHFGYSRLRELANILENNSALLAEYPSALLERVQHEGSPELERIAERDAARSSRTWLRAIGPRAARSRRDEPMRTLYAGRSYATAVAFAAESALLAVGYGDGSIRTFDVETGEPLRMIRPFQDEVSFIGFEGRTLLAGCHDGAVQIFDARTLARRFQALDEHQPAFSPARDAILTVTGEGAIRRRSLDRLQVAEDIFVVPGDFGCAALSPGGATLAVGRGNYGEWGSIELWNLETGGLEHTLAGHGSNLCALAFSPDGALLASGSTGPDWELGEVRLWDVRRGALVKALAVASFFGSHLTFSPDGTMLASASFDQRAPIWSVPGGELLALLDNRSDRPSRSWITAIAFSPGGDRLAHGGADGRVRVWANPRAISGREAPPQADGHFLSQAVSADSGDAFLALYSNGVVRRAGVVSSGEAQSARVSLDERLVLGLEPNAILILRPPLAPNEAASIELIDAFSGRVLARVGELMQGQLTVVVSRDRRFLTCLSRSGTVREGEESELILFDLVRSALVWRIRGGDAVLRCAAFTPDSSAVLVISENELQLRGVAAGSEPQARFEVAVKYGARAFVTHDGASVLLWSGQGALSLLELSSGRVKWSMEGLDEPVLEAELARSADLFVVWGESRKVRVFEASTGRLLSVVQAGDRVRAAAFSPDSAELWLVEESQLRDPLVPRRYQIMR